MWTDREFVSILLCDDSCRSGVASNAIVVAEICTGGAMTLAVHGILNFWPWRVAAADAAQMTASDAKWTVVEDVPNVRDSEWTKKMFDAQNIK
jgi:hypothetical protein